MFKLSEKPGGYDRAPKLEEDGSQRVDIVWHPGSWSPVHSHLVDCKVVVAEGKDGFLVQVVFSGKPGKPALIQILPPGSVIEDKVDDELDAGHTHIIASPFRDMKALHHYFTTDGLSQKVNTIYSKYDEKVHEPEVVAFVGDDCDVLMKLLEAIQEKGKSMPGFVCPTIVVYGSIDKGVLTLAKTLKVPLVVGGGFKSKCEVENGINIHGEDSVISCVQHVVKEREDVSVVVGRIKGSGRLMGEGNQGLVALMRQAEGLNVETCVQHGVLLGAKAVSSLGASKLCLDQTI